MARCPQCGAILSDVWIKKQGASLMGKVGGRSKRRVQAREAARIRWEKERETARAGTT